MDKSDYNGNNSNAKGFGVDTFANENNNKLVYNNTNSTNNTNVNDNPFGKKQNLFGTKPANGYNNEPKTIISNHDNRPKYNHQWALGIKYDVQKEEIILNVSNDTLVRNTEKL